MLVLVFVLVLQALGVPARFEGDSPTGSPIKTTAAGGGLTLFPQSQSSGLGLGLGLASVSLLSPQASQAVSTPGKGLGLGAGQGSLAAMTGAGAMGGGGSVRGARTASGIAATTPLLAGGQGPGQGKGMALTMFSPTDSTSQSALPTAGGSAEGGGIAALAAGAGTTPLTLLTASLSSPSSGANAATAGGLGPGSTVNSLHPMPMSPLGIAGGGVGSVLLLSPTGTTAMAAGVGVGLLGSMGGPNSSNRTLGSTGFVSGAPAGGQGLDRDLALLTWWSRYDSMKLKHMT